MSEDTARVIRALQKGADPNPQRRRVANPKPKAEGEPMHPPSRTGYDTAFAFCLGLIFGVGFTTIISLIAFIIL